MFVRFRERPSCLQASLVETRRVGGKVCYEHIASLGSIPASPSVVDHLKFWQRLFDRLGKLWNRIDPATEARIRGAIAAKVPMVTPDEQHNLKLENAQADERQWSSLGTMHRDGLADHERLVAGAEAAIEQNRAAAENAERKAAEAKDRVERLKRGEDVPGGFAAPLDAEQILRDEGLTTRDINFMRLVAELPEEVMSVMEEAGKAARKAGHRATRAAVRCYARKLAAKHDG